MGEWQIGQIKQFGQFRHDIVGERMSFHLNTVCAHDSLSSRLDEAGDGIASPL
jgi:hypothetical protein